MSFVKILIGTIVAATLAFAAFASSCEAKSHNHGHHHWRGGPVFVLGGTDYVSDCYVVKKYTRSGRPYLVEVCS